ncbi:MAG: butyrate kinase [Eubacteriales bacterium]|nr:butyrate kinase [Eubacteriales bacterium]
MSYWIFTINPGSTSTKTALFKNHTCIYESTVRHNTDAILQLPSLASQLPLRLAAIEQSIENGLTQAGLSDLSAIDAFVGRGGLMRPLASGTYAINAAMVADLVSNRYGVHASNLGAPIALDLAHQYQKLAVIVDPVTVDEMIPIARYTGLPQFKRHSIFHALNHKAIARAVAVRLNRPYPELNIVIAHLGGGISVAAHRQGLVIDVNNALEEGPFSPERAGTIPTLQLLDAVESGLYTMKELRGMLVGRGGLLAYTGTADAKAIEAAATDDPAKLELIEAMAFQISKAIGAMATTLHGKLDAIVLTGGLAYSPLLTRLIQDAVQFLAPIMIIPGENEMQAMAEGAFRVLTGQEMAKEYIREE